MRMSYDDKIKKINNDRILMLKTVKENINISNVALFEGLDVITSTLNFDEKNTKEYKSIVKAKQLIFELTEEIANATSVEEIIKLRKKINYYINKIKKVITERNISQELFDKMHNNVDYLRKNVASYIRFLKRESKLIEISNLHENIDSLSPESSSNLKKLISNELRYNKQYFTSKTVEEKSSTSIENTTHSNVNEVLLAKNGKNDPIELPLNLYVDSDDSYENEVLNNNINQIKRYLSIYPFDKLFNYDGTFLKNCVAFFRNIPKYRVNKKIIKLAEKDYFMFYHGQDLGDFIDYSKKRNSIKVALGIIFERTYLSKREIECLFDHDKCIDWIIEFCNSQNCVQNDNMNLIKTKYCKINSK